MLGGDPFIIGLRRENVDREDGDAPPPTYREALYLRGNSLLRHLENSRWAVEDSNMRRFGLERDLGNLRRDIGSYRDSLLEERDRMKSKTHFDCSKKEKSFFVVLLVILLASFLCLHTYTLARVNDLTEKNESFRKHLVTQKKLNILAAQASLKDMKMYIEKMDNGAYEDQEDYYTYADNIDYYEEEWEESGDDFNRDEDVFERRNEDWKKEGLNLFKETIESLLYLCGIQVNRFVQSEDFHRKAIDYCLNTNITFELGREITKNMIFRNITIYQVPELENFYEEYNHDVGKIRLIREFAIESVPKEKRK